MVATPFKIAYMQSLLQSRCGVFDPVSAIYLADLVSAEPHNSHPEGRGEMPLPTFIVRLKPGNVRVCVPGA